MRPLVHGFVFGFLRERRAPSWAGDALSRTSRGQRRTPGPRSSRCGTAMRGAGDGEGRIHFQKAPIQRRVSFIEKHLDDAVAFVQRIEQVAVALFRFEPRLLRAPRLGHVARRAELFDDLALRAQQRNRPRAGPTQACVDPQDAVLELENARGPDRQLDRPTRTFG